MWQDIVVSVVNWAFLFALVPSILHRTHKPALTTSALTAFGMFTLTVTYASLSLFFATFSTALLGLGWLVLAIQRYRMRTGDGRSKDSNGG